ncbi:MAG TPA: hypothetical protein VNN79_12110 [Actinomycetota bacterium]|nr:hypothetical protein [Actinomycetota bacterium]
MAVGDGGLVATTLHPGEASHAWRSSNIVPADRLEGVSCTPESICVAVTGDVGDIWTSTNPPAGAASWRRVQVGHALVDLSCPSLRLCVAVGGDNAVVSTHPATAGGGWRSITLPLARSLRGVSCPSASFCAAVDDTGLVFTTTNPGGPASGWTSWNVDPGKHSLDVECPTRNLCLVVDRFRRVLTSTDPTGGPGTWTIHKLDQGMQRLSCSSDASCVGVRGEGFATSSSDPTGPDAAWVSERIAPTDGYRDASCPSSSLCLAVGDSIATTSDPAARGSWSVGTLPTTDRPFSLIAVDCPDTTLCLAGGFRGVIAWSTDPGAGVSSWQAAVINGPRDGGAVVGMSCLAVDMCVAADFGGHVLSSTDPTDPGSWVRTARFTDLPVRTLSCPSRHLCFAGASYGQTESAVHVLHSSDPTGDPATWTAMKLPVHGTISDIDCPAPTLCVAAAGGALFTSSDPTGPPSAWKMSPHHAVAVSCPTGHFCLATGPRGDVWTSATPTDPASWRRANVDGVVGVDAAACPSPTLCVGVDDDAYALTGSAW